MIAANSETITTAERRPAYGRVNRELRFRDNARNGKQRRTMQRKMNGAQRGAVILYSV